MSVKIIRQISPEKDQPLAWWPRGPLLSSVRRSFPAARITRSCPLVQIFGSVISDDSKANGIVANVWIKANLLLNAKIDLGVKRVFARSDHFFYATHTLFPQRIFRSRRWQPGVGNQPNLLVAALLPRKAGHGAAPPALKAK